ncbi:retention module-containing protein, partial [Motilimonas sp. E26]|uniref:retention module-containing protein n=1 Tax=Motilimonas sp. E26 TaxID=2865674 RepID=UPI001E49344A
MVSLSVKSVSVVSAVNGKVFLVNSDGSKTLLKLGDKVQPGQVIEATNFDAFDLEPVDDPEVFQAATVSDGDSNIPSAVESEIAALQQALLAGADPTQLDDFEAPAAGEEAATGSSISGGSGISRTGEQLLSGAGYDTDGIDFPVPESADSVDPIPAADIVPSVPTIPSVILTSADASINSQNVTVSEGDFAVFSVLVSNAKDSLLSLVVKDGSALSISDYNADFEISIDNGVTWNKYADTPIALDGSSVVMVRIDTTDDAIREVAETFQVEATLVTGDNTQVAVIDGTIYDDAGEDAIAPPPAPEAGDTVFVSLDGPVSVIEGETTSPYNITLSQAIPAGKTITVEFEYTGTAEDGSDFTGVTSVVLTGPASSGQFTLTTLEDALPESTETITVSIKSITDNDGAFEAVVIEPNQGSVTTDIIDNDETSLVVNAGLNANNIDVLEGEQATFAVNVGKAAVGSVLTLLLADGTADGSDYEAIYEVSLDDGQTWAVSNGQVVLTNGGDQTVLVRTQTIDDAIKELPETYSLNAELVSGTNTLSASGTATITDDSVVTPPTLVDTATLTLSGATNVVEGESATYTVSVDKAPATNLTVQVITGHITTDNGDVIAQTQNVVIQAGTTSTNFTVATSDDAIADSGEQFNVSLGSTTGGSYEHLVKGNSVIETTINDQTGSDRVPGTEDTARLTLSGATIVAEGASASYTVSVDKAPATDLTVQVITGHITTDNGDVLAQIQNVVIKAGSTSTNFSINTTNDAIAEGSEQYNVTLGTTTGGGFENLVKGNSAVTTAIIDNDNTSLTVNPNNNANNVDVLEGDQATFTVNVGKAAVGSVLTLSLADGTADSSDYEATFDVSLDGGLTWSASNGQVVLTNGGDQTVLVRTQTIEDTIQEALETYLLNAKLDSASDTLQASGTATITDGVVATILTLSGATVVEEGTNASYTVSVDKPPSTDLAVQVITGHITTDNGDVTAQTQDVVIKAGTTSTVFSINTIDDAITEGNEQYSVTLGTTTGGDFDNLVKGNSVVITTIVDNDNSNTTLSVNPNTNANNVDVIEGEQATFTVNVGKAAVGSVLTLSLADGTADSSDYEAAFEVSLDGGQTWSASNGQVVLTNGGDQEVLVRTQTTDDIIKESPETYSLNAELASSTNILNAAGTATITDDSVVTPPTPEDATLTLGGATTVVEGESATYTIAVDNAPATDLTVQVITGHITTDNGDVIAQTQDVVIKAGSTSTDFTVDTKDDELTEGNELFNVTLGTTTGGGFENLVKGNSVVTTTIADNDTTSLIVNPNTNANNVDVIEGEQATFAVNVGKAAVGSVLTLSLVDGTADGSD